MAKFPELRVKIFVDGADKETMAAYARKPWVRGFTTNPTLMRKAGVASYETFARGVLECIPGYPVSFEVFADDAAGMERQARKIAQWGPNVYVKIPVTNTLGEPMAPLARRLSHDGVKVNVTAILTLEQVMEVAQALEGGAEANVSVFAGRVADTGRDPVPMMRRAAAMLEGNPKAELIWASPREVLNIFQADECGCHIITVTSDILGKLELAGKDLEEFSLDTVKMFHRDALACGYEL